MKQSLRYGLTTPMRPFELPEVWDGEEALVVNTDTEAKHEEQAGTHAIVIPNNTTGSITIRRHIIGSCQSKMGIDIGRGCDVRIIEEITGSGTLTASIFVNSSQDSKIEYSILQAMDEQSIAILEYTAAASQGTCNWLFCGLGADTTRARIETLAGDNLDTKNHAAICGSGQQQFDIHVSTKHLGKNSRSDMLTRSVLDDTSRAIYHGLIHIASEASEVDSYQKDEVILVSAKAGADAIPNLEIHNNKVRCTHGASIGKLDEEKLFYLKSRGIAEADAKQIITEGFLEPLILPAWHKLIREKISRSSKAA